MNCPIQSLICLLLLLCIADPVKTTEKDVPHLVKKHFIYGKLDHKGTAPTDVWFQAHMGHLLKCREDQVPEVDRAKTDARSILAGVLGKTEDGFYELATETVKVYVKLLNNSPFLACMDVNMAYKETIDPFYSWTGPDGGNLKWHSNVNLTETGKLMLMAFDTSMSGSYSCTLSYKTIKHDVTYEKETFRSYNFDVLAFREPDYMYQVNIRYTAKPCHHSANLQFVENLLIMIKEIIASVNCQVKNTFHKCHVIKAPEHSLQNQLFISFKVIPEPHEWETNCVDNAYDCDKRTNKHILKAREIIEELFSLESHVLEKKFANVREIKYIKHSLHIVRVDTCRPGYGKNEITHSDCPGCCVVCDPGTYSSDNSAQCEVCKDIRIPYFGAASC